jgi:hypothetical protein
MITITKGSQKQINWASKLKVGFDELLERALEVKFKDSGIKNIAKFESARENLKKMASSINDAETVIEFRDIVFKGNEIGFDYVNFIIAICDSNGIKKDFFRLIDVAKSQMPLS